MVGRRVWQGACMAGGMHGRDPCMVEGMCGGGVHGRRCAWQEGMCIGGVWRGGGVHGRRGMHGRGRGHTWCGGVAGETATAEDGTHPTGIHSCLCGIFMAFMLCFLLNYIKVSICVLTLSLTNYTYTFYTNTNLQCTANKYEILSFISRYVTKNRGSHKNCESPRKKYFSVHVKSMASKTK